jgi:prophage regulatory protein
MDHLTTQKGADQFLGLPQVLKLVPVSRSTLYAWMLNGLFPNPYKIGPRRVAWRRDELEAWQRSRPPTGVVPSHTAPIG